MENKIQVSGGQTHHGEWLSGQEVSAWSCWQSLCQTLPCAPSANQQSPCPQSSWGMCGDDAFYL